MSGRTWTVQSYSPGDALVVLACCQTVTRT